MIFCNSCFLVFSVYAFLVWVFNTCLFFLLVQQFGSYMSLFITKLAAKKQLAGQSLVAVLGLGGLRFFHST